MKKRKVVTIQIIWLSPKYRETSSRFGLCCVIINVYVCVLDKPAGVGSRHFIQKVSLSNKRFFCFLGQNNFKRKMDD